MDWMQIFVLVLLLISGFFTVWFRDILCSVICSSPAAMWIREVFNASVSTSSVTTVL